MENNQFAYILRSQIKDIFAQCSVSNEKGGLRKSDSCVDSPRKRMKFPRGRNKIEERGWNGHEDTGWSGRRRESNIKREEAESIFGHDGKTLLVQSYTSLIYEHCEEKVNVVLANRTMHEGKVEMQISGEGESFLLPCKLDGNILSAFSPQLKKGVYNLFFFMNKERMYSKLLSCGVDKLSKDMPCLPLHVIEISNFGHVAYGRGVNKQPAYNIRVNNHVHTNKGLLNLYGLINKKYNQMANREGIRDGRVTLGTDYQLHTNSDNHFYNFLSAYKETYTDHHPQVNGKKGGGGKKKVYINNMHLACALKCDNHLEQGRIPWLYKKLLYDQCPHRDKVSIMSYHARLPRGDFSSGGLSAHVFAKDQLGGTYSIFSFDLAMGGVMEKNPQVSSLLRFNCEGDRCEDMRRWNYVETINCRKNNVARKFYFSNRGKRGIDVECPVPAELINNKNAFKTYAPGIRLSECVSLFFEDWNCDLLPIGPFVPSEHFNMECEKVCAQMRELSTLVRNAHGDMLSFDDLCQEGQERDVSKLGGTEKRGDNHPVGKNEQGKKEEDDGHHTQGEKGQSSSGQADSRVLPHDEHLKCATKQTWEEAASNCTLSSFVSFVITIEGKIYHSVLPISRLLLLFVVNYWMHFTD
ncbi:hypothetical protein AK88_05079 [Plasmodium fragile]|uniref:Uncharacterized protein n=1 Tax=Plasmodium fragile TaxID=5857 RepID=A0A0D9QER5_PLAFR|nr:uncharacterized protein AK88_05079 [Plasmodium fragile]KJP85297.1 hypothetical protein AK88_05079 [Plasmodium fragile]